MAAHETDAGPAHPFEPVDGLPELAVTAFRRAGFEKLSLSQKHILGSIEIGRDLQTKDNRVIASHFASGKTTVLCLIGSTVIMRCSDGDTQPPRMQTSSDGTEFSSAPPHSGNTYTTGSSSAAAKPLVLIISPFAETAREAGAFLDLLLTFHGSSCATFAGDVLDEPDFFALSKWPAAVVGTFDRLLDLIEPGHMDLSGILFLAIDDLDVCIQNESFDSFLQVLHEKLPECQVIVTSSNMTQDLVAPVTTLTKSSSPISSVVRMGRFFFRKLNHLRGGMASPVCHRL